MINTNYLQNWLTEIFKPCAIVYSSDLAEKAIKKNNLTPADFIRPFADLKGKKIEIPFQEKTNQATNLVIRNFFLDCYDNSKYVGIPKKSIQTYFCTMFQTIPPKWDINSPLVTKSNIEPFINIIDSYSSPWFKEYEELFFECQRFDDYELFQQPLLNICFCLIQEKPTVINKIKSGKNLPRVINCGIYDTPKDTLVIVLNDMSASDKIPEEEIQNQKNKFRKEFPNIFFWDINKNKKKQDESEQMFMYEINKNSEFWKRYFHKVDLYNPENDFYRNKENKFGAFITQGEMKIYKEEFQSFFMQNLLKKIIAQIQSYSDNLKKHKSNKFTQLFKLGKKEEIIYHENTYVYKLNEDERAYFNLGILYFFFS